MVLLWKEFQLAYKWMELEAMPHKMMSNQKYQISVIMRKHIKKYNSVKNNSQLNIDLDSLTSDTSFSVSQFADVSSDVDKKEAYNTHNKAQLSEVGESDVASNLKGNNMPRNDNVPAEHREIVSTHDDIEKGEPSNIVNVTTVTKIPICLHITKSLSKVWDKTNKTPGELTENEVKVNEQDGDNNPK